MSVRMGFAPYVPAHRPRAAPRWWVARTDGGAVTLAESFRDRGMDALLERLEVQPVGACDHYLAVDDAAGRQVVLYRSVELGEVAPQPPQLAGSALNHPTFSAQAYCELSLAGSMFSARGPGTATRNTTRVVTLPSLKHGRCLTVLPEPARQSC